MKQTQKPLVFISTGEPLGIGPEVTVRALQQSAVQNACRPILLGEPTSLRQAGWTENLAQLIPMQSLHRKPKTVQPSAWGGEISFKSVELACKLAAQSGGRVVTAPISKQSWALAGVPFTGHTEFLRRYYGPDALMTFVSGRLCCALVSEHFAVADLPHILTRKRIEKAGQLLAEFLHRQGIKKPQIAMSALNPHGGDKGQFGCEEQTRITPAVRALCTAGIAAQGPYPVDSLWSKHVSGQFDGILCMYHDQALLGLKLAAREPIVHITAGLPLLRTSPTHGTAFDIAGRGVADPSSMAAAILYAANMHR